MNRSLYMIDGMGEPPETWYMLGHRLRHALGFDGVQFLDRENPLVIRNMRAELPGTKIFAVGHSLGAYKLCELSQRLPIHAAALIEIVRPNWLWPWGWFTAKKPIACNATHRGAWLKAKGLPPAVKLIESDKYWIVDRVDHNDIIAEVEADLIEWMRGTL